MQHPIHAARRRSTRALVSLPSILLALAGPATASSGVPGFEGTGGPGGTFDVHVPPGTTLIFDTTSTVFVGGPGGVPTTTQTAVNGVLDLRDLYVPETSILKVQGPNPVRILATGNVVIEGQLVAAGQSNRGVVTLLTATVPEPGAAGVAGGGRGGTGSYLTTQVTPRGGSGLGAFDAVQSPTSLDGPHGGGQGGEAGYNSSGNADTGRRPGGGGGGAFAADVVLAVGAAVCADQNVVGLDGEPGFDGAPQAVGVVSGSAPPRGGARGRTPFVDGSAKNDFWGKLVTPDGTLVSGELPQPWAGSGGGAGGDTVRGGAYPPVGPFLPGTSEKGAGGGGGGGQVRIQALGDVVLGPRGAIDVRGGNGSGGESTGGINRIGGGSGGGSGGHLIIETASRIDLSQVNGTFPASSTSSARDVGLLAPGGQGGAGANNLGGAITNGIALPACRDAMPDQPAACVPASCSGCAPIVCAGGDGGPGVIQLHVPTLDGHAPGSGDLVPPTQAASSLFRRGTTGTCSFALGNPIANAGVIKPPPVGAPGDVAFMNDTVGWGRLVPTFAVPSGTAPSRWIPFGGVDHDAAGRRLEIALRRAGDVPDGATVRIELQATTQTLAGRPDEAPGAVSGWVADVRALDERAWAFVRLRARVVEPAAVVGGFGGAAVRPALELLRVPVPF